MNAFLLAQSFSTEKWNFTIWMRLSPMAGGASSQALFHPYCSSISVAWPGTRASVHNCLLSKLPLTFPLGEISGIYQSEMFGKLSC